MTNGETGALQIGFRLGQSVTPEFATWLADEVHHADRADIDVRPLASTQRPGALGAGVVELVVALGGAGAIAGAVFGPMVKPAMEFLWGKLFDYLKGNKSAARPLPPNIQIVVLGDVIAIDPATMSRDLPTALAQRLSPPAGGD